MRTMVRYLVAALLLAFSLYITLTAGLLHGLPSLLVAIGLFYMAIVPGRVATVLIGHLFVVLGCFLITWGLYLLPACRPELAHILLRPLFWGLICLFGGICAIFHGFCHCVRSRCEKKA